MGNSSIYSTPNTQAKNTNSAYQGSIDNLFEKQLIFRLYNPVYEQYLFVSNDKKQPDRIVESHSNKNDERNNFKLKRVDNTTWNGYTLYNIKFGEYIFVSNDKSNNDHIVESHPHFKEERNCFMFNNANNNNYYLYTIFNWKYNEYVFVSNDIKNNNNVVLSHKHKNEQRNLFEIQLINPQNNIINIDDIKSINDDPDDDTLCIVCMDNTKDHVILPCGHLCVCGQCKIDNYSDLDNAECPLCRHKIKEIKKIYQ